MPELPEVETIVRDLRPHLKGALVVGVDLRRDSVLRFPDPDGFRARLLGSRFIAVRRKGKFIHVVVEEGDHLVVHLGMTGNLTLQEPRAPFLAHTHLVLALDQERELRFRDPRRFGRILLGRPRELSAAGVLPRLGPEPLGRRFWASGFPEALRQTARPVKAALLDQGLVAGCGNIYADEACFLARVKPTRRGHTLSRAEARRIALALPQVMRRAVRLRGTSFSDYRDGFGTAGEALAQLFVYGRGGLACPRCCATLRQTRVGGRTTVYCQRCQR